MESNTNFQNAEKLQNEQYMMPTWTMPWMNPPMQNQMQWNGQMPTTDQTQMQIPTMDQTQMQVPMTDQTQMPFFNPFPQTPSTAPLPETYTNPLYLAGYLRTQIGRYMHVEFLIGNSLQVKNGFLVEVGDSYIVLQPLTQKYTILCDLYSIKFAGVLHAEVNPATAILLGGESV